MGNVLVKRNKKLKGVRRINVYMQEGTEGELKVQRAGVSGKCIGHCGAGRGTLWNRWGNTRTRKG